MPRRKIWSVISVLPSESLARLAPAAAHDRVGHARDAHVGLDVVDAHDVDARSDAQRGRCQRPLEPLPGGQVEHLADGRLAARAEQDRPAEHRERVQVVQHGQVVLGRLAEADARVDDELLPADACGEGAFDGALQVGDDLGDHVPVARLFPVVHQHERHAALGGEAGEAIRRTHTPDVVDHIGAGVERRLDDGGARRVDAQRHVGQRLAHGTHHGLDPAQLVLFGHLVVSRDASTAPPMSSRSAPSAAIWRACATAAATGSVLGGEQAVAAERVGRHVDDAHHERPAAPHEVRGRGW